MVGEGHGHSAPGQALQDHHQCPLPKEILESPPPPPPHLLASLLLAEAKAGAAYIRGPTTEPMPPGDTPDLSWGPGPAQPYSWPCDHSSPARD